MLAFNNILVPQGTSRPQLTGLAWWVLLGLTVAFIGCSKPVPSTTSIPNVDNRVAPIPPKKIFAQGQIMPAGGILKLYTTPGDVLVDLPVRIGQPVKQGDVLAVMRSERTLESQQVSLIEQKNTAIREWENTIKRAELNLSAAEMKIQQVASQQQSLDKQAYLIEDAEKQVATSENILSQLNSIATDSLTREFVGQLEVDRQRLSIAEAKSKVAQQRSSRDQAAMDLSLAAKVATAELNAAQRTLEMAREANPARAFDAQIAAIQTETGRAVLSAPMDGVILAIHTSVGGSVVQTPLIELANLDSIVCELEVNVAQARWIEPGQKVTVHSDSLLQALTGVVKEKSQIVGKPRLRSLDPLAAVDYRTLSVIVTLDHPELANPWLQLQVEGQIELASNNGL